MAFARYYTQRNPFTREWEPNVHTKCAVILASCNIDGRNTLTGEILIGSYTERGDLDKVTTTVWQGDYCEIPSARFD